MPTKGYEHVVPTALESLSRIPLFSNLSGRQVRKILKGTSEDHYESGDVILRQDGTTQSLFIILEGTASVVRDGRTLARHGSGEFFGEISVIDSRPRTASVVADGPMRCLVLPHDTLHNLVTSDPSVAWSLLQTLASRLRDTDEAVPG